MDTKPLCPGGSTDSAESTRACAAAAGTSTAANTIARRRRTARASLPASGRLARWLSTLLDGLGLEGAPAQAAVDREGAGRVLGDQVRVLDPLGAGDRLGAAIELGRQRVLGGDLVVVDGGLLLEGEVLALGVQLDPAAVAEGLDAAVGAAAALDRHAADADARAHVVEAGLLQREPDRVARAGLALVLDALGSAGGGGRDGEHCQSGQDGDGLPHGASPRGGWLMS